MNEETKIPKIIHYIWFGGKQKDEATMKNIESWKKYNPDYEIIEWNEDNVDINTCRFLKQAYSNKKYAFASDWVRFYALKNMGGIYLDTDVEVTKSFDDLLDLDGFMCFENDRYIQSAVIGSKKDAGWVDKVLKFYDNRSFEIKNGKFDLTTSPVIISLIMKKYYNVPYKNGTYKVDDEVTILPREYFAPKDYTTGEIVMTENTYTIHKFTGTWFEKRKKKEAKFLTIIRKTFGKAIFSFFTLMYLKSIERNFFKQFKIIIDGNVPKKKKRLAMANS